MRRRALQLASATSLLVGLAVALLWVRSYFVHDAVMVYRGRYAFALHSMAGQLLLADASHPHAELPWHVEWIREDYPVPYGGDFRRALVMFSVQPGVGPDGGRLWMAPHWPLVLLATLPPTVAAFRHRRRRRWITSGACRRCGYNLTGNVSGVCPECGSGQVAA